MNGEVAVRFYQGMLYSSYREYTLAHSLETELTALAASLDCAASSPICDDISMVVAGFTSTSALADDVVMVSRDSVVQIFWLSKLNYDSIQCLGLSKRKCGYMHMQQQCQTEIVTAKITERLSLLLLLVNPEFGHNEGGWC